MSNNHKKSLRQALCVLSILGIQGRIFIAVVALSFSVGCAHFSDQVSEKNAKAARQPKLIIIIMDALKRNTLMETIDVLPNLKAIVKGDSGNYPYVYFRNVLGAIPSSSKPSNTTLLTGVYPYRHGVPSTVWFDREAEKVVTLNSLSQRRTINILEKTRTDTIFDYGRRSEKTMLAVGTQVAKGIDSKDWIKQSVHLWGQAFCINLFLNFNPIPDGVHLDRGTTKGLFKGYWYSLTDGLEGKLKTEGNIPDLVVVHYVGMDIFTHYPRRFMVKENWSVAKIQQWYLKEVLDPEIGKVSDLLKKNGIFENTVFFFVTDHGQTRVVRHIVEQDMTKRLAASFKIMGRRYPAKEADVVIMPGAGTKAIYVKNGINADWMTPPRLIEDVKPMVDALMMGEDALDYLNTLLIAQYPGERADGPQESEASDPFWCFDAKGYLKSSGKADDFLTALKPLSELDQLVGESLRAAYLYRRNYQRESIPDIILINKPGYFFVPDKGKYAHHGSIYPDDMYVSFVISGPAIRLFSDRCRTITQQIDTVDLVPMAAHLAGIKIDKHIDGKNRLFEER
jgi:arylsulfatase A-like enzyme